MFVTRFETRIFSCISIVAKLAKTRWTRGPEDSYTVRSKEYTLHLFQIQQVDVELKLPRYMDRKQSKCARPFFIRPQDSGTVYIGSNLHLFFGSFTCRAPLPSVLYTTLSSARLFIGLFFRRSRWAIALLYQRRNMSKFSRYFWKIREMKW
jgi:hypothetical protein